MNVKELIEKLKLMNPESKIVVGTDFSTIEGNKCIRSVSNSDLFSVLDINKGEESWLVNEGANDFFYENNESFISRDFAEEINYIKNEAKNIIKKLGKKNFIRKIDTFLSAISVSESESESTKDLALKMKNVLNKNDKKN
jgi:N-glycosylase/DNA lyase